MRREESRIENEKDKKQTTFVKPLDHDTNIYLYVFFK